MVVVGGERFTQNTMTRGLSVGEVLHQVRADSDSEEEYSTSGDDVWLSDVGSTLCFVPPMPTLAGAKRSASGDFLFH